MIQRASCGNSAYANGVTDAKNLTADDVIEAITAAGLDYHDFKVGVIVKRMSWGCENLWEQIAEFPTRNNPAAIAKAWQLSGLPDPYAD
ncbi:hypothetical protein I5J36_gp60 [Mycobacterium phage Mendokysei]|uniref:Uncharacterized protein n=1 Tax=Mycobacterium phage Mendokysei TaxID=2099637 RepID=A0A2P1CGC1_9CAUD|nr:hypothetical protein I5J36_gp60 [Mycobacterium phage Mendokysei]AVJ50276.1 hypothetical protein SEA_MENDOKYSEI_60 [Mycobacterium phage Mendokysei]